MGGSSPSWFKQEIAGKAHCCHSCQFGTESLPLPQVLLPLAPASFLVLSQKDRCLLLTLLPAERPHTPTTACQTP